MWKFLKAAGKEWLNTLGGRFGGYGLYLLKGKPVFCTTASTSEVPLGRQGGSDARQALDRVRLQVRRTRASAKGVRAC